MFITQRAFEKMQKTIKTLTEEAECTLYDLGELKRLNIKDVHGLEKAIVALKNEKQNLASEVDGLKSKNKIEIEEAQHKVKLIMEMHNVKVETEKQELIALKNTEVATVKDQYRDKLEKQLEQRGSEMKEMYTTVLDKLTTVTGTLSSPQAVHITKKEA